MFLGVDTGGTFTDFVLVSTDDDGVMSLSTHKVLSTPEAPEKAILQGIRELNLQEPVSAGKIRIVHGSTVATNAALEGKGVVTAFITNRGFRDLLSIGRQTRPQLYSLSVLPQPVPVPPELCLECGGRAGAQGTVLDPLTEEDIASLIESLRTLAPQAVAICFLFSFLDDSHEVRLEQALQRALPDLFISRSTAVLPEYREYERSVATWLNASLGPLVEGYLLRLKQQTAPSRLSVMQSSGGIMAAEQAAKKAVNLLLSGPAGGLAAAATLSRLLGLPRLMTFDMGGTSTDVALIDGDIRLTTEGSIGPWPVAVPMVDMHTIGAGGGSVASIDSGGLLHVGPRSAGASPGPACYGKDGAEPTVTDANLILGRLPARVALGGDFTPDTAAAEAVMDRLAEELGLSRQEAASGIIELANEHMARALRVISVERGHDPADFHLCCFGGAGGLHLCALAEALGMDKALIPANAGVLSALGMLTAPVERQYSRTHTALLESLDLAAFDALLQSMRELARDELAAEGFSTTEVTLNPSADLRYRGQSATLNLDWQEPAALTAQFHEVHETRYGHALSAPVELVNIRLQATGSSILETMPVLSPAGPPYPVDETAVSGYDDPVPIYARKAFGTGFSLMGPAIVVEDTATSFIDRDWQMTVDDFGNLVLRHLLNR